VEESQTCFMHWCQSFSCLYLCFVCRPSSSEAWSATWRTCMKPEENWLHRTPTAALIALLPQTRWLLHRPICQSTADPVRLLSLQINFIVLIMSLLLFEISIISMGCLVQGRGKDFLIGRAGLLLIYRPWRDGRLSWPGWLTHSGHLTHEVVTCQP